MTTRTIKALAVLVATLCVTACNSYNDWEYLSLSESMEIVEYGRTNLDEVVNDTEMPIKYRLERDDYTLFAYVDRESLRLSIIFEIKSERIPGITFTGTQIRCAAAVWKIRPYEVRKYGYPENGFRFIWAPTNTGPCVNSVVPTGDDREIEVSIYDSDRQLVAIEKIKFEVKKNGVYRDIYGR